VKKIIVLFLVIIILLYSFPVYSGEVRYVKYEGPKLEIVYPRNGILTIDSKIKFYGLAQFINKLEINKKTIVFKEDTIDQFSDFEFKIKLDKIGLNIIEIYYEDFDKKVHSQTLDIYYEPMPKGREQILIGPEKYLEEYNEYKPDKERDIF